MSLLDFTLYLFFVGCFWQDVISIDIMSQLYVSLGEKLPLFIDTTATHNVMSITECSMRCLKNEQCQSFAHSDVKGNCMLYGEYNENKLSYVPSEEWTYYARKELILPKETEPGNFVRMCYFTNWAQYRAPPYTFAPATIDAIDPFMCSHIIYAFANLQNNKLLKYEWNDDVMYSKINALKSTNTNLKTLLAVGGATNGEGPLNNTLMTRDNMAYFVSQATTFLTDNNFDGISLDFSGKRNKEEFAELVKMLRESFDTANPTNPMEITMYGPTSQTFIDGSFNVTSLSESLDYVILGTYSFMGDLPNTLALHTALYPKLPESGVWSTANTAWVVDYWLKKGMPKEKIVITVAATAMKYKLADVTKHQPGDGGTMGETIGFQDTCAYLKDVSAQCYHDDQQVADYCVQGETWLSFDGSATLKFKAGWVVEHGLGGITTWSLPRDDFSNFCTMGAYNLTKSWTTVLSEASGA